MWDTNLLACLFRRAFILAEQGLMILSEGEMYCLTLNRHISHRTFK